MEPAIHPASRAAFACILLVMALPIVAVPFASIPYELQKSMLAALALGMCILVGAVSFALSRRPLSIRVAPEMLAVFPLLIISIISSIGHPLHTAVLGAAFEVGTVAAIGLMALIMLAASLVASQRHALYAMCAFLLAATLAGSVAIVGAVHTSAVGETLMGAWQQAGFVAMLAFLASLVYVATAPMPQRILYSAVSVVSLVAFSIMFTPAAAVVGAVVLVATGTALYFRTVPTASSNSNQSILLTFGLAVVGLLTATLVATIIKIERPVEPLPSFQYTEFVIGSQYIDTLRGALVGTGEPYAYAFNKYRTIEVNESPFWNSAPETAGALILDLASSRGLLGLLAFLVIPASLASALWRLRKEPLLDPTSIAAASVALASVAFMLVAHVGTVVLLISAASLGLVFRAAGEGRSIQWGRRPLAIAGALVLLLVSIGAITIASRQMIAAEFFSRVAAEDIPRGDAAVRFLELAARSWSTPKYEIAAARAIFLTDFTDSRGSGASQEELIDSVTRLMQHADQAGDIGRNDISAVLFRGSVYTTLVSLGYEVAREKAEHSLNLAQVLARNLPEAHYLRAVLAYNTGAIDDAMKEIATALKLKPDYAEAIEFERRLNSGVAIDP